MIETWLWLLLLNGGGTGQWSGPTFRREDVLSVASVGLKSGPLLLSTAKGKVKVSVIHPSPPPLQGPKSKILATPGWVRGPASCFILVFPPDTVQLTDRPRPDTLVQILYLNL